MSIIQGEHYLELFEEKKSLFIREFNEKTPIDFFESPDKAYRYRAEFGLLKIQSNSIISHKLFQIEFQSSRNNEAMVSLIYHKELGDEWSEMASNISNELDISIIGRSKNRKIIIGNDYVTETYQ